MVDERFIIAEVLNGARGQAAASIVMPRNAEHQALAAGAKALPRNRAWSIFYTGPIVTIEVGGECDAAICETFQVARDILTKHSPVFTAMLEGNDRMAWHVA